MNAPLVSVVIAAWNAERFLPETLASVLAQTWTRLEVIVVDDGSTDDTPRVVEPFRDRIRYERRGHRGLAAARNEGIRLATGDCVALLDADDLWHPEKIAIQVEILGRHPESGLVACNGVEFEGDTVLRATLFSDTLTSVITASDTGELTADFHRTLIAGDTINCPAQVLIPRAVLQEIGPFIDARAQDYDYYLRVSARYPLTLHRDSLAMWRNHPDSMSGSRAERGSRWRLDMLSVLLAHRADCRAEDRHLLETHIRELIRSLGHRMMMRGREGSRLDATRQLWCVLRMRPWPPTVLAHLAGLWSPPLAYRIGASLTRPFRSTE